MCYLYANWLEFSIKNNLSILNQLKYNQNLNSGTKDLEILKRHSKVIKEFSFLILTVKSSHLKLKFNRIIWFKKKKRVFATPSKRDLQSKGIEEEITYPNIYFTIDDFDSVILNLIS